MIQNVAGTAPRYQAASNLGNQPAACFRWASITVHNCPTAPFGSSLVAERPCLETDRL